MRGLADRLPWDLDCGDIASIPAKPYDKFPDLKHYKQPVVKAAVVMATASCQTDVEENDPGREMNDRESC